MMTTDIDDEPFEINLQRVKSKHNVHNVRGAVCNECHKLLEKERKEFHSK